MGLFSGAKSYFREHSGAFSSEKSYQKPIVIVTDIMLSLYMFDAYRTVKESEATADEPYNGSIRDLAHFLWRRIERPDNAERIESWQTHVVTFDVPGCSPRAKEATQQKRSAKTNESIDQQCRVLGDDDPLPKPFSSHLRVRGFLGDVIERLIPLFQSLYTTSKCVWGECILQWRNTPIRMYRDANTNEARIETLRHAQSVSTIGEGDMSICYWVQYFNAESTLVITKDTDMLLLLSLVTPSRGKTLVLRLDFGSTVDYIDMVSFKAWLVHRYASVYDAFLYVTVQGNDYVEKITKGCGATTHLDELAKLSKSPLVTLRNGTFHCDEQKVKERLAAASVRGSLIPTCDVCIRQALWYLFYALHAINGSNVGGLMCAQMHENKSLFGWELNNDSIIHAKVTSSAPCFIIGF